jgi:drug/metabolite transporter (DMT)-like permease
LTFKYADKSGVNSGTISTCFSSSIAFTGIIFWCKYGEKLNLRDGGGIILIFASVALIAVGGK